MNPEQQHRTGHEQDRDSKPKSKETGEKVERLDQADADSERGSADKKERKAKNQEDQRQRLDEAELTPAESEEKEKAKGEAEAALRQIYESLNQKQRQSKQPGQVATDKFLDAFHD